MRSLWSARAGARFAQAAFALDAAVFDLAYIAGPRRPAPWPPASCRWRRWARLLALTGAAVVIIGRQPRDRPPDHAAGAALPAPVPAPLGRSWPPAADRGAGQRGAERHRGRADRLRAVSPRPLGACLLLAEVSAGSILGSLLLRCPHLRARTSPGRLPRLLACYAGGLAVLTAAGPLPAAARRGRPVGRAVPGAGAGHPVRRGGGRGAPRQRHGNAGLAELDHERRSGGRRRGDRRAARRGRRQPAYPGPRPGLRSGARRGGERQSDSDVSAARARPVR